MKKCCNCESINGDDAEVCANCGAVNFQPCEQNEMQPQEARAAMPESSGGGKVDRFVSSCKKVNGERNFLINGFIAVIALVISLVVLFAPVKISLEPLEAANGNADYFNGYFVITDIRESNIEDEYSTYYTVDDEGKHKDSFPVKTAEGITGRYMYVNQSIFDFVAALSYIAIDNTEDMEKVAKITEQYNKAKKAIDKEFSEWLSAQGEGEKDNDFIFEAAKRKEKIVNDYLAELNVLGYMSAYLGTECDAVDKQLKELRKEIETGSHTDKEYEIFARNEKVLKTGEWQVKSALVNVRAMIVSGFIIFAMSLAVAITSLVYLIRAIVCVCAKKPQNDLFGYLKKIIGLIAAVVLLTAISPLAMVSGGGIAITLVGTLALLLCGVCKVFVVGKGTLRNKVVYTIKNTVITALTLTIYLVILSTYAFTSVFENNGVSDEILRPIGHLFGNIVTGFVSIVVQLKDSGFVVGYNDGTMLMSVVVLLFTLGMIGSTILTASNYNLYRTANIEIPSKKPRKFSEVTGMVIKSLVCFVIILVSCLIWKFVFIGMLTRGEKEFFDIIQHDAAIAAWVEAGVQLWVMFGLLVIAIVCENVIKTSVVYTEEPILQKRKKARA